MRTNRKLLIFLVLISFFTLYVGAEDFDTTHSINRVTISGRQQLAQHLSKKDVRPSDKARVIERLAELSKDLPSNKNVQPHELFNPILGVLSNPNNKKSKTLRKIACESLISFVSYEGSDRLVAPLGRIVSDREDYMDVRKSAAIALGRFINKDTGPASMQLITALQGELKRGLEGNNASFVAVIVESLGQLHDKRSFVPLMRVIRSNFPNTTKRAAQRALENLKWF